MRKITKFLLNDSAERLSSIEMCSITGSCNCKSYHYYLRCDQNSPDGMEVNDCSRETAEKNCGKDYIYNAVCVQTYY